jgi:hypothetical protein
LADRLAIQGWVWQAFSAFGLPLLPYFTRFANGIAITKEITRKKRGCAICSKLDL